MNADSDRLPGRGSPLQVPQAAGRWSRQTVLAVILTAAICFAGMGLLLRATRLGPIVWTDSILYLTAARTWLEGLGYVWPTCSGLKPNVVYPPLLPMLLAASEWVGADPLQAGRLINVAAFGLSGALVAIFVARATKAPLAGPVAALLFLVAPGIALTYLGLMSDGPYLAFCLMTLLLLAAYAREGRTRLLVAAGAAAGLAYLTRYIGMAVVLSGWAFLALRSTRLRTLVREGLIFGGVALAPIAAWYARNLAVSGAISAYRILLRPIDLPFVLMGPRFMADWFLPGSLVRAMPDVILMLLSLWGLAILLVAGFLVARRMRSDVAVGGRTVHYSLLAIVFLLVYLTVYFGSVIAVFIPPTPSERYLTPIYTMVVVLGMLAAVWTWRRSNWLIRGLLVLVSAALLMSKTVWWTKGQLEHIRTEGLAYTSNAWQNSETIAGLGELNPASIYSNDVTAIAFLAGKAACTLPEGFHVSTAEVDWNFESPEAFRDRMAGQGTVLVLFNRAPWETYREVTDGLLLYREYADGRIYVGETSPGQ